MLRAYGVTTQRLQPGRKIGTDNGKTFVGGMDLIIPGTFRHMGFAWEIKDSSSVIVGQTFQPLGEARHHLQR